MSGGIRAYEVDGRSLVDGYGQTRCAPARAASCWCPWPNRLRDGRYEFDGETFQVPLSEPEKMNAIHGFLRWEHWHITERSDDRVVMEHTLHPRAGYPFALHVAVEYSLDDAGLTSTVDRHQRGTSPLPVRVRRPPVPARRHRAVRAVLAARRRGSATCSSDERAIPTGAADVGGHPVRLPRAAPGARRGHRHRVPRAGRDATAAWVRLWSERRTAAWACGWTSVFPYYMLFTGDTLPEVDRRRRSIGVGADDRARPTPSRPATGLVSAGARRERGRQLGDRAAVGPPR